MQAATLVWRPGEGWTGHDPDGEADLVLWFASPELSPDASLFAELRHRFPKALIAGCSAGAEICAGEYLDDSAVAAAVSFDKARVKGVERESAGSDHAETGRELAQALAADDLRCVFVLADGIGVDGDALVEGLTGALPPTVVVTGGLSASRDRQSSPFAALDGALQPGRIVCLGFYGESLRIGWGSEGGWAGFGPARSVTRSAGRVLFELDGRPALDLYKDYLGEAAQRLPQSASMFPLLLGPAAGGDFSMVRRVMSVDEAERSLTFAGAIPRGWSAQLTHGGLDGLIDGAGNAAREAIDGAGAEASGSDALGLIVSCVGRKRILGQRVADEIEAMGEVFGSTPIIGFYSFGEICPHGVTGRSTLHNQTMTLTVLREAA